MSVLQVDVITTVILILAVVIGFVFSFLSKPVMSECSRIVNQSMKRENAVNDECVDAIELTRTNGLQDYYRNKVKDSIHDFRNCYKIRPEECVFAESGGALSSDYDYGYYWISGAPCPKHKRRHTGLLYFCD